MARYHHPVSQDLPRTNDPPPPIFRQRQSISIPPINVDAELRPLQLTLYMKRGRDSKGHTVEFHNISRRVGAGAFHLLCRQGRRGEKQLANIRKCQEGYYMHLIWGRRVVSHTDEQCRNIGTIWNHFLFDGHILRFVVLWLILSHSTGMMMVHRKSCQPKRPLLLDLDLHDI